MLDSFTPTIIKQDNGKYTVEGVPIFKTHSDRGWECDRDWMDKTIQKFYQMKNQRPRLIIGHTNTGQEKPAKGFAGSLKRNGDWLYADYQDVPEHVIESLKNNEYPNRSIEVSPKSHKIMAVALLGGNSPHFEDIPEMVFEQDSADTIHYKDTQTFTEVYEMLTDEQKTEINDMVKDVVKESVGEYMKKYLEQGEDDKPKKPEGGAPQKMMEDDDDKKVVKNSSSDEAVKYQEQLQEQSEQIEGLQKELYQMANARIKDEWEKRFYSERISSTRVDIAEEVDTIMQLPEEAREKYFDRTVNMLRGPKPGSIGEDAIHKNGPEEEMATVNQMYKENRKANPSYTYSDALRDARKGA